jgi:hypothetical protein
MRRVVWMVATVAGLALGSGTAGTAYAYPPHYGRGGYGYARGSFDSATAEVRAAHSRYAYKTHPRSYYNLPAYQFYYRPYYQPSYQPYYQPGYRHERYYEYGYGHERW